MHSLRSLVVKVLTPQSKTHILYWYLSVKRILKGRPLIQTSGSIYNVGTSDKHCFFGYYDVTPFNKKGGMLFVQLNDESGEADIMFYDRSNSLYKKMSSSNAWNWQQGSRLRWFPGSDDVIVYNDYDGGHYISRIINSRTNQGRILDYPLYDIDRTGKLGLSLDFGRLGVKRPGYGYTCRPYKEPQDLQKEGIDLVDIENNTSKRIITYREISELLGEENNYQNKYINHLAFSSSGKKFMFFWISIIDGFHMAYMLVYDLEKGKILPLETEKKVSHYLWLDDESLLCTVYEKNGECRYVIYGLDGSKRQVFKDIDYDGHPIWYKDGLILTDSYPDKNGYQRLMVCNLDTDKTQRIMEIFQEPAISVERRTDLHPRYDEASDTICIDASPRGIRELLLIDETNKRH